MDSIIAFLFGAALAVVILTPVSCTSQHEEREKAIKANVGKWIINEKTGYRTFIYTNEMR